MCDIIIPFPWQADIHNLSMPILPYVPLVVFFILSLPCCQERLVEDFKLVAGGAWNPPYNQKLL